MPSVKDEKITGTSSAEYQLKSAIAKTLSGSDTITITFLPGGLGQRDGEYVLTLSDGKQIKVSLEGIGIPGKYTISVLPATLFDKDTAALCSSLERKFVITTSGCLIPTITGENITGPEASEYLRTSPLPISYSAVSGDTVTITFSPTALGKRTAKYELTFSDGKKYTIDLLGRGKNAKYNVSIKPDTMFVGDSRQLCDSVDRTLFMTRTGCAILTKSLTQIQGAAAGDYRILQDLTKPPDPLGANEVMQIRFKPTGPGLRKATLVITLDDGSLYAIDLVGVGTPSQTLTLSTSLAIATDTIGGDVAVPVFIKGLTKPEPLEMNVFFDTNLVYLGTVSLAGSSLDVPNSRGVNTSKIRFTASDVDLKVASAYSHFRVFADSLPTSNVRFDNLVVTTASAPCEYFTSGATTKTTVTGPSGCGITALSDFMRYNQIERLRIYPNPTQGSITVESSHSLGTVTIAVSDAVGSVRLTENTELSKAKPATLDLSKLPSGLYFVRVSGSGAAVPVVVSK